MVEGKVVVSATPLASIPVSRTDLDKFLITLCTLNNGYTLGVIRKPRRNLAVETIVTSIGAFKK
jgi:hypothetical protein